MKKPFHLDPVNKRKQLLSKLSSLTKYHYENCREYQKYIDIFQHNLQDYRDLEEIPYLPARFFKEFALKTGDNAIARATSSGTSGSVSTINLSGKTMLKQSIALNSITKSFIGSDIRPMLILEKPSLSVEKTNFNARAAGVLGFKKFGEPIFFAYNEDEQINLHAVNEFFSAAKAYQSGIIFGFTFVIWKFVHALKKTKFLQSPNHNIFLIHGGGWKKLKDLKVPNSQFEATIQETLGVSKIHNYYGMVEQTGSIFFECEYGKMHASEFSDVLIRDVEKLECLPSGQTGLIQVFSTLPESYPGHSILTEDIGLAHADCMCECGRYGTILEVHGRLPESEIRGCSNVP